MGINLLMYLKKSTILQNKGVKHIAAAKFCHSALSYYNRFQILKFTDLHKVEVGKFVQAHFLKMFPKNLFN